MEINDIRARFSYHAPTTASATRNDSLRAQFRNLAYSLNESLPDGREKSLVITHLEDAMHWAIEAISRKQ